MVLELRFSRVPGCDHGHGEYLAALGGLIRAGRARGTCNPAQIIPAVLTYASQQRGRHIYCIGEPIWPGR